MERISTRFGYALQCLESQAKRPCAGCRSCRMSNGKAIMLQAILFTLPQLLAASLLPLKQGILHKIVYS
jgi:hypothetical protein